MIPYDPGRRIHHRARRQSLQALVRRPRYQAAAWVTIAIDRLGEGNTSNAKSVGDGVSELRINRGPGYRVYFGWDSKVLVILLGGGTKRRQQSDIQSALRHWRSYKTRKAAGRAERK